MVLSLCLIPFTTNAYLSLNLQCVSCKLTQTCSPPLRLLRSVDFRVGRLVDAGAALLVDHDEVDLALAIREERGGVVLARGRDQVQVDGVRGARDAVAGVLDHLRNENEG